jgi:starch-binding outer membrane protein, SusD/RagB family
MPSIQIQVNPMRSIQSVWRGLRLLIVLLLAVSAGACTSLEVTNPNQPSSQTFWQTSADADRGLTAVYNSLELLGVFGRWQAFGNDLRSDIGTARTSPWGDLANFNAFQLSDYNFEVNRELWIHNYVLISRANQVTDNVPGIQMDPALRDRMVGEAKFLRGLAYFNLVTLFENVPLITTVLPYEERPASAPPAQTWAQIEKDFSDAAAVLPLEYSAADAGRATKGAALGMLGKARLQQRKWADASAALAQVISGGKYALLANYADNFRELTELRNTESLFEAAMEDKFPIGVTGLSFPKMIGPCYRPGGGLPEFNPTFCDGRPTRWYFEEFQKSRTTTGAVDPRLDVTLMYNRPDMANEQVFGRPRASYFVNATTGGQRADTMIYFRKYGEWEAPTDQRWDNPVNYRVLRYADVLLMQAEALNEQGQTAQALPLVNQVRRRASKSDLAGLSAAQLRDSILYERMFELGLESSRFNDLRRQNLLNPTLASHDFDFTSFTVGKSERLPIPTTERNLNPNVPQNPGW